jgi:hypothetical protein
MRNEREGEERGERREREKWGVREREREGGIENLPMRKCNGLFTLLRLIHISLR